MAQTYIGGVLREVSDGKITASGQAAASSSSKSSASKSSTSTSSATGGTPSAMGGSSSSIASSSHSSVVIQRVPTTPSNTYTTSIFKMDESGNVYELTKTTSYLGGGKFSTSSSSSSRYIGHVSDLSTPTPKGEIINNREYYFMQPEKGGGGFYVPAENILKYGVPAGYKVYASAPSNAVTQTRSSSQTEAEYELSHAIQLGYLTQTGSNTFVAPTKEIATHMYGVLSSGKSGEYLTLKQNENILEISLSSSKQEVSEQPKRVYYYTPIGENETSEAVLYSTLLPTPEMSFASQQEKSAEMIKVPIKTYVAPEKEYSAKKIVSTSPTTKELEVPKETFYSAQKIYSTARENMSFQKELTHAKPEDITFKPLNQKEYERAVELAKKGGNVPVWGVYSYKGKDISEGIAYVYIPKETTASLPLQKPPTFLNPDVKYTKFYEYEYTDKGVELKEAKTNFMNEYAKTISIYYSPQKIEEREQLRTQAYLKEYEKREKEFQEFKANLKEVGLEGYIPIYEITHGIKEIGYFLKHAGESERFSTVPFGLGGVVSFPLSIGGSTATLIGKTLELQPAPVVLTKSALAKNEKLFYPVFSSSAQTTGEVAVVVSATAVFNIFGKAVSSHISQAVGEGSLIVPYATSSIIGGVAGGVYGLATKPEKAFEYAVGGAVLSPVFLFASNPYLAEQTIDAIVKPNYYITKSYSTPTFTKEGEYFLTKGYEHQTLYKESPIYGVKKIGNLDVFIEQRLTSTKLASGEKGFFGTSKEYGIGKVYGEQVVLPEKTNWIVGKPLPKVAHLKETHSTLFGTHEAGKEYSIITSSKMSRGIFKIGDISTILKDVGVEIDTMYTPSEPSYGVYFSKKGTYFTTYFEEGIGFSKKSGEGFLGRSYTFKTKEDLSNFFENKMGKEITLLMSKQYIHKEEPKEVFQIKLFGKTQTSSKNIFETPTLKETSGFTKSSILAPTSKQILIAEQVPLLRSSEVSIVKPAVSSQTLIIPMLKLPSLFKTEQMLRASDKVGMKKETLLLTPTQTMQRTQLLPSQSQAKEEAQIIQPIQLISATTIVSTTQPELTPPPIVISPPTILPPSSPPPIIQPPTFFKLTSLGLLPGGKRAQASTQNLGAMWSKSLTGRTLNIYVPRARVYFGLTPR